MQLTFSIDAIRLPRPAIADRARSGMERWHEQAADNAASWPDLAPWATALADDPAGRALLEAIFGNSPFLTQCLLREQPFLRHLLETGPDDAFTALLDNLRAETAAMTDITPLMRALRIAKRRSAVLIGLADICGLWDLATVTRALSHLADTALSIAASHLLRRAADNGDFTLRHPDDPEKDSGLIILGMGKLGAHELNYSSDIDIIVFYDDEQIVYTGRKSIQECFTRLTRDLVRIMEERTADGYVFRTDLRLRPDPGATPPAISRAAAEIYYEGFGQNWERAALIKARPVAGDRAAGDSFIRFLRPFIWRKNLDFAAIQDIHSIKRQIYAHKGGARIAVAGHNIKLGRGGIREIEFFAQTQQLIWGGRDQRLRCWSTLAALNALSAAGHVEPAVVEELTQSYTWLRTLEHRLQMIDDQQTQTLPSDPEPLLHLAVFMGFTDLDAFSAAVRQRLERVEYHYARLFEDAPSLGQSYGSLVFTGGENDPETLHTLAGMGFSNTEAIASTIRGWHHGRIRATRSTRARELLTELTPALLRALASTSDRDKAFLRFDEFLSKLPAGVPLFSLFYANPALLELVAEIMGDAPRLAEHLARHTWLLDAVLSQGFFDPPASGADLDVDLDRALAEATDYQEMLDRCRRWVNDRKFQIGVQVLRNLLDPEHAGRAQSEIADTALSRLLPRVEEEFARAHGRVPGAGLAIVAMGKMGSREMTATSDLDLILIYDVPEGVDASDGAKPLSPATYFARLTQRLLNAITIQTGEGTLYEVDMRLRPSGNAGPIATSLEAFRRYHREAAWTWEHLALARARVVAGPPPLVDEIKQVIRETLCRPRDPDKLLMDVADMRERMAKEHTKPLPGGFWEVKHRRGGLVDIEFIGQYLQLRHAHDHPDILCNGTGCMIDRAIALGLLPAEQGGLLRQALRLWTAVQTVLRQTIEGAFHEDTASDGLKRCMAAAAEADDFATLKERMDATAAQAFAVFEELVGRPGRELITTARTG
jgi:glutamate-ammonia-ligase adenylyltransferase